MSPLRWYALAFVALLVAGVCLGVAGLGSLRSLGLLRASIVLSVVAASGGVVAIAVGRRG